MLRGLRGSNSVCGRIIQKENFPLNDNTDDLAGEDSQNMSQSQTLQNLDGSTAKRKRKRRIVRVLDVAESARCGHEKFIPFSERLHPWTTIKVSTVRQIKTPTRAFQQNQSQSTMLNWAQAATRLCYTYLDLFDFHCIALNLNIMYVTLRSH